MQYTVLSDGDLHLSLTKEERDEVFDEVDQLRKKGESREGKVLLEGKAGDFYIEIVGCDDARNASAKSLEGLPVYIEVMDTFDNKIDVDD
jgi:hypothetical protein